MYFCTDTWYSGQRRNFVLCYYYLYYWDCIYFIELFFQVEVQDWGGGATKLNSSELTNNLMTRFKHCDAFRIIYLKVQDHSNIVECRFDRDTRAIGSESQLEHIPQPRAGTRWYHNGPYNEDSIDFMISWRWSRPDDGDNVIEYRSH